MNSWRVERNLVVCLPRICTPRFMAAGLLKHTVPALLVRDVAGVDLDSASVNITDAVRLQPLSSVHLDFIIAGYCHSGTTSLHHHLRSHPSVDMWHKEVHELLWQPVFTRAELRHLTSMRRDRTRGIRSTWAGTAPGLFNRLSALPSRPKMIVMARDPLSQLDSILSHGTTAFFNPIGQELGMDLVRTGTNAVYNMQASMLEERVLVVPTLRLSIAPDETIRGHGHGAALARAPAGPRPQAARASPRAAHAPAGARPADAVRRARQLAARLGGGAGRPGLPGPAARCPRAGTGAAEAGEEEKHTA
ncbi:unnamed protein product [Prorocentrum cordatum]|uniref:Protein-tyrosine sulfotransferase n=1 Tax=Prorocentrum cordatum TaxID=2364126 RepID=A0ABN9QLG6_9DINO|nr:unnamed protein product [Polarella glacialis]